MTPNFLEEKMMRTLYLSLLTVCIALILTGCPSDPKSECGNGACESGETTRSCPADCGSNCGDGACNGNETQQSCSLDCGFPAPVCGDGTCNGSETPTTCSQDCQSPTPRPFSCGGASGTCALLENYGNCCAGYWVECPSYAGHYCAYDGLCYTTHCPASDFCSYTGIPCATNTAAIQNSSTEDEDWHYGTGEEPLFFEEMQ